MSEQGGGILRRLADILEARKRVDPSSSYIANLYSMGLDAILKKVGEESIEVVIAAKDSNQEKIVHETADLWFHGMAMLARQGLSPDAV